MQQKEEIEAIEAEQLDREKKALLHPLQKLSVSASEPKLLPKPVIEFASKHDEYMLKPNRMKLSEEEDLNTVAVDLGHWKIGNERTLALAN